MSMLTLGVVGNRGVAGCVREKQTKVHNDNLTHALVNARPPSDAQVHRPSSSGSEWYLPLSSQTPGLTPAGLPVYLLRWRAPHFLQLVTLQNSTPRQPPRLQRQKSSQRQALALRLLNPPQEY